MLTLALWAMMCARNDPPLCPAKPTWADLKAHRAMMHAHHPAIGTDRDEGSSVSDNDNEALDPITAQGGLGGGGGMGPSASLYGRSGHTALRRSVYERHGHGGALPLHHSSRRDNSAPQPLPTAAVRSTPIQSDLGRPQGLPSVNYKHFYIVNRKLAHRVRSPYVDLPARYPFTTPRSHRLISPQIIDAISSVEAGGLAGHSEIIYALEMVRHQMRIPVIHHFADEDEAVDPYDTMMNLSGMSRAMPASTTDGRNVVEGRDWLLSGSRDRTMRLWALSTTRPRVVKAFLGGHEGSVLSLFTFKEASRGVPGVDTLWAVTAGSDGKICLWDVESSSDAAPTKTVQAHSDSVLCVRGNSSHLVSCSKGEFAIMSARSLRVDQTIKVFTLPDLEEILRIDVGSDNHRATVNAVAMSDDYMCVHLRSILLELMPVFPQAETRSSVYGTSTPANS